MLKQKRSKVSRMRGTNSHGWGHKKKHRGKGHRGGVGLSGTGARGDVKKSAVLSNAKKIVQIISAQKGVKMSSIKYSGKDYFGKRGFHSIHKKANKVLSISFIEENFDTLVQDGYIVKEGTSFVFDSTAIGYDKILGRGNFTKKVTVICNEISANAKLKIENAGGKVEVLNPSEDDFEESSEK